MRYLYHWIRARRARSICSTRALNTILRVATLQFFIPDVWRTYVGGRVGAVRYITEEFGPQSSGEVLRMSFPRFRIFLIGQMRVARHKAFYLLHVVQHDERSKELLRRGINTWIENSKAVFSRQSVFDLHYIRRLIRHTDCAQLRVPRSLTALLGLRSVNYMLPMARVQQLSKRCDFPIFHAQLFNTLLLKRQSVRNNSLYHA